jgi:hypothetical protein
MQEKACLYSRRSACRGVKFRSTLTMTITFFKIDLIVLFIVTISRQKPELCVKRWVSL